MQNINFISKEHMFIPLFLIYLIILLLPDDGELDHKQVCAP